MHGKNSNNVEEHEKRKVNMTLNWTNESESLLKESANIFVDVSMWAYQYTCVDIKL